MAHQCIFVNSKVFWIFLRISGVFQNFPRISQVPRCVTSGAKPPDFGRKTADFPKLRLQAKAHAAARCLMLTSFIDFVSPVRY
jgi:hypothetical protein